MLGYDPQRMQTLHELARAVATHLAGARCTDAAAEPALALTDLVRRRVEEQLLPAIARITASEAMLAWLSSGPGIAGGLSGAALGHEVAERVTELGRHLDGRDAQEMADLLRVAAGDQQALATLFAELDPGELLELVLLIGAHPNTDDARALGAAARATFVAAAEGPGLPTGYVATLVRRNAEIAQEPGYDRRAGTGVALSYLFHGEQLPSAVLVEAVTALRDVELDAAAEWHRDPDEVHRLWLPRFASPVPSYSTLEDDFSVQEQAEDRAHMYGPVLVPRDPMYALLDQLGRDGAAGRALFTDPAIASYVFGGRDVLADGGRRVTAAAAAAAAGRDVVPTAPERLLADAAEVASSFVNHFGPVHGAEAMHHTPDVVAASVAQILGNHMPSVHQSLLSPVHFNPPIAAVAPYKYMPFGDVATGTRAVFDRFALAAVTDLAISRDEGLATMRALTNEYQQRVADAAVGRLARGDFTEPNHALEVFIGEAGLLEGYLVGHIGQHAQHLARSRDDAISFWFDALATSAEAATSVFGGRYSSAVVGAGAGPLADQLKQRFADDEAAAVAQAESEARAAAEALSAVWCRELYEQRLVVPAEMPDRVLASGHLRPWDELSAADRQLVVNLIANTKGRRDIVLDPQTITDQLKLQQADYFDPDN